MIVGADYEHCLLLSDTPVPHWYQRAAQGEQGETQGFVIDISARSYNTKLELSVLQFAALLFELATGHTMKMKGIAICSIQLA